MLPEGAEKNLSCQDVEDLRSDPLFFDAGGFIFEQLPGEIVFVPSAWHHQVHNEVRLIIIVKLHACLGLHHLDQSQLDEFFQFQQSCEFNGWANGGL
jgi:hypothetical protein